MIQKLPMNRQWKWCSSCVCVSECLLSSALNPSLQKLVDAIVEKAGRSVVDDSAHVDISVTLQEGQSHNALPRVRVVFDQL